MHPESGFRIAPNWPKLEKQQWRHNLLIWRNRQIFWRYFIRDWPEIRKSEFFRLNLVWVLTNIWRLGWVRDTKFYTDIHNKMLLNPAKCQGHSFYCFWVIKGKPIEGAGVKLPPAPPSVGLNHILHVLPKKSIWHYLINLPAIY